LDAISWALTADDSFTNEDKKKIEKKLTTMVATVTEALDKQKNKKKGQPG
jgi:hypothetical protein